ncbi:hypothetical protein LguiB_026754 [Lonicera macranthoides]
MIQRLEPDLSCKQGTLSTTSTFSTRTQTLRTNQNERRPSRIRIDLKFLHNLEEYYSQHISKNKNDPTVERLAERLFGVILVWLQLSLADDQCSGVRLRHERELVKIIKDKVLEFLKQNSKHEDTDLIGMHSRKEKMEELLNVHSNAIWLTGFGSHENSEVNRAWTREIPGWVTPWEAGRELAETKP